MNIRDAETLLIEAIRDTDEYKDFISQRDSVFSDSVSAALLKE